MMGDLPLFARRAEKWPGVMEPAYWAFLNPSGNERLVLNEKVIV